MEGFGAGNRVRGVGGVGGDNGSPAQAAINGDGLDFDRGVEGEGRADAALLPVGGDDKEFTDPGQCLGGLP